MATVAAILKRKGHEVTYARPTASVSDIVRVLSTKRIGAVLVLDSEQQLHGIISERDIVHALASHGARALDMNAGELMTRLVKTATGATTIAEAMTMMTEGRFRHLPVVERGAIIGIISIGDVVKSRIEEQETEVDSLRAYVAGAA
jgi:CBS domain-containing protein